MSEINFLAMKRLSAAVFLMLGLSAFVADARTRDVKILCWNIQNGMWADQGNDYDNFVEYVKSEDPDICIWCEAESRYRTGTETRMAAPEEMYLPYNWDLLARRYGHEYVCLAGKRDGFPQVITSKYPIRLVSRLYGDASEGVTVVHGAGWARIKINNRTLNIVTVHTWPQKYAYGAVDTEGSSREQEGDLFRAAEMKYICENTILAVPDAGKQLWVMAGDFNAISPADNFHYEKDPTDKAFLLHDYIRSETQYKDVVEALHPGEFQHSTLSGRRIDFIYVTPPLLKRVRSVVTVREGFPESRRSEGFRHFCDPSDHYPILMTLRL